MTDTFPDQGTSSKPRTRRPLRLTWRRLFVVFACLLGLTLLGARHRIYCYYASHRLSTLLNEIRLPEAVTAAQRFETIDCPQVRLLSIQAYRQSGDLQAADRLLTSSESLIDSPKRVAQERTLLRARNGRVAVDSTQLAEMLTDPKLDSRDVCEAFAIGFRLSRRFEEAALLIDAWKSDWPTDHRPFYHEGLMYQTTVNWKKAVSAYQNAIRLNPLADQCRIRLGECLNQILRAKEACEQFQVVTSRDETNVAAWRGLGDGLKQQGDNPAARSAYLRVLKLAPASYSARLSIAEIDFYDGAIDSAEKNVEELSSIWPDDVRTLYLKSRIATACGRQKEAATLLERWKTADLAVQQMEAEIQLLAQSMNNLDLQVSIGTRMLQHFSRELGQQYVVAALQIDPNHAAAVAAFADFKTKQERLKRIPIPEPQAGRDAIGK